MSRVILAMSGGVDSSVAAWLLRQQGHEVIGVFMRHGQETPSPPAPLPKGEGSSCEATPGKQGCCSAADADDARRVADMLGIPFYAVNFEAEFTRIVDYFTAEYLAGRTPNPCIVCNTWLKFGKLFEYADRLGAEFVATGHYARLLKTPDGGDCPNFRDSVGDCPNFRASENGTVPFTASNDFGLYRGLDPSKDQSYVLFGIRRELLPRLLFPVGEHRKEEIRQIAERIGLRVAAKRDSQEICFVPNQDHAEFIRQRCGNQETSGEIVLTDGTVVGRHDGFEQFTIGQRKGLQLAFGTPRYVIRLEADTHRVVIGTHEELARRELFARGANWLCTSGQWSVVSGQKSVASGQWSVVSGRCTAREAAGLAPRVETPSATGFASASLATSHQPLATSFPATVKIRYRSRPVEATVTLLPNDRFHVEFAEPCHGVAPGQAAVCYQGDRVLGGGWIE